MSNLSIEKERLKLKLFIALCIIVIILAFTACSNEHFKPNTDVHYVNDSAIIIKHSKSTPNQGYEGYAFLIRRIKDTTEFTELNSNNFKGLQNGGCSPYNTAAQLYWSKTIGDTLHFDYIKKSRFWKKLK